jgi:peptidylprolyl isomerase
MKAAPFFKQLNLTFCSLHIVLFFATSCVDKKEVKKKKPLKKEVALPIVKKKKKPAYLTKQYILDTITTKNAVAFFTDYGKKNKETKVKIETRLGTIIVKLYKDTPLHRASFLYMVKSGYYDTTCFYRVVPDFIVQGGNSDNLITPLYKEQLHDYQIPSEFRKNRKHKRGIIAAARDWENNPEKKSSPFEFYFIQAKRDQSHLNYEHTVFGEIIDGLHVIDDITEVEIDKYEWPQKEIPMKISVIE